MVNFTINHAEKYYKNYNVKEKRYLQFKKQLSSEKI